jgi:signal transduction histidine kinase
MLKNFDFLSYVYLISFAVSFSIFSINKVLLITGFADHIFCGNLAELSLFLFMIFVMGKFLCRIYQIEEEITTALRNKEADKTNEMLQELNMKNAYLEHAAKILRHDMHSGINVYIPRGIKSLERRLDEKIIEYLKLAPTLKLLTEGLKHTQKVYWGVYEFTQLVKKDSVLTKKPVNLKIAIREFLRSTAYMSNVKINDLPTIDVNESLFCTAIDNLIRNGLKYNDERTKTIKIYSDDKYIIIEDNGRGMTNEEFLEYSKPYIRKDGQKETGSGLGLNIAISIFREHGFDIFSEQIEDKGTKIFISYT